MEILNFYNYNSYLNAFLFIEMLPIFMIPNFWEI